jgi:hypothetical protein
VKGNSAKFVYDIMHILSSYRARIAPWPHT